MKKEMQPVSTTLGNIQIFTEKALKSFSEFHGIPLTTIVVTGELAKILNEKPNRKITMPPITVTIVDFSCDNLNKLIKEKRGSRIDIDFRGGNMYISCRRFGVTVSLPVIANSTGFVKEQKLHNMNVMCSK
jgi:hypothetical protein